MNTDWKAKACCQQSSPDPSQFMILRSQIFEQPEIIHIILEVQYRGCTNYEGRKILVYDRVDPSVLLRVRVLDPHFSDTDCLSPIASFPPTERGWQDACDFAAHRRTQ